MSNEVCAFFKRGLCRFGNRCWNIHEVSLSDEESAIDSGPQKNDNSITKNAIGCSAQNSTAAIPSVKKPKRKQLKCLQSFYAELLDTDLSCSVCLEIFIKPTMLNCMHMFCDWCINSWENIMPQCPICRLPIITKILCLPFNNHILKIIERAPEDIKTAYKELDAQRTRDGPKEIEPDEYELALEEMNNQIATLRASGYYSI